MAGAKSDKPVERTKAGRFAPGHSGNIGGTPKAAAEIRALARTHCVAAVEVLVKHLKSKKPYVAISAAQAILDRGIGKPVAEITVSASDPLGLAEVRGAATEMLADADLRLRVRAVLRGGVPNDHTAHELVPAPALLSDHTQAPSDNTLHVEQSPPLELRSWWSSVLDAHPRIAIAGGPRTGKTSLSVCAAIHRHVIHTDSLISAVSWDDAPAAIIAATGSGPVVVEGVQVARCLRKGLKVDAVVWLSQPRVEQTPRQASMSQAVLTVFQEWMAANAGAVPVLYPPEGV